MPEISGIEFYNDDGSIQLSWTTYCGAFFGYFATNGQASGSIQDSRLIGRRLLSFCPTTAGSNGNGSGGPECTLNSATGVLSWQYTGNAPGSKIDTVVFGAY